MERINGIAIAGRFYEAVPCGMGERCASCQLNDDNDCGMACMPFDCEVSFRYSPELTERLNNPKTKEK